MKKKIIIVKLDRTGSTMLFRTLSQHPEIRIKNEVFNEIMHENKSIDEKIDFINTFLNMKFKETRLGYTINLNKYNLLTSDIIEKLFTEDAHVIMLIRKNILKKIISAIVVEKNIELKTLGNNTSTNYWGLYNVPFEKKVHIKIKRLIQYYNVEKKCYNKYLEIYNKYKDKYNINLIYYEDLTKNIKPIIDNTFNKLGLEIPDNFNYNIKTCHKLLSDDLRDVIINYDEVMLIWNKLNKYNYLK